MVAACSDLISFCPYPCHGSGLQRLELVLVLTLAMVAACSDLNWLMSLLLPW
jgi:hypothetical protein